MLTIKSDQYIYPPRAQDAIPRSETEIFGMLGWIAQLKYNDSHALIKYCENGNIELWNRHAERFRSYWAPDYLITELRMIGELLNHKPGTITILDGGLLDQKHAAIKNTIVIWDILAHNNEHLVGTTYNERYNKLSRITTNEPWCFKDFKFGDKLTENVFIPCNYDATCWEDLWDTIHKVNLPYTHGEPNDKNYEIKPLLEGLVFKDPNGTLEMGFKEKNNSAWLCRSRVATGRHRF